MFSIFLSAEVHRLAFQLLAALNFILALFGMAVILRYQPRTGLHRSLAILLTAIAVRAVCTEWSLQGGTALPGSELNLLGAACQFSGLLVFLGYLVMPRASKHD